MNKAMIGMALLLGCIGGCGRPQHSGGTGGTGQGKAAVSVGEAPAAPRPAAWAQTVQKAIGYLGKTKDEVVAAFGAPGFVLQNHTETGGSLVVARYRYPLGGTGNLGNGSLADEDEADYVELQFDRGEPERARVVECNFSRSDGYGHRPDSRKGVGEIWEALGVQGSQPDLMDDRYVQFPKPGEYAFGLRGHLADGHPLLLYITSTVAPLAQEERFSTATDRREAAAKRMNPDFRWRDCLASKLLVAEPKVQLPIPKLRNPLGQF